MSCENLENFYHLARISVAQLSDKNDNRSKWSAIITHRGCMVTCKILANPCETSLRGNGVYMYNIIIMGNG